MIANTLDVEWSAASAAVAADLRQILGWDPNIHKYSNPVSRLLGNWDNVAEKFVERMKAGVPRTVILGRPGAGKTVLALHLQRELLDKGRLGVPVLLPVASWNPEEGNLYRWAASRLAAVYPELPELGKTIRSGHRAPTVAEELFRTKRAFLILDELDQMPKSLQPSAIRALNSGRLPEHPLVVTCRSDAYADAVGAGYAHTQATDTRDVLARAVVIELQPLSPEQIQPYLMSVAPDRGGEEGRWKPVLRRLEERPNGPLAHALSTPLMVWLVRTIYESTAPTNLLELDDEDRPDGYERLEAHLLDEFIFARYAEQVTRDEGFGRWAARDAKRWLTFLARHMDDHELGDNPGDLAWWRLHEIVKPTITNLAGVIAGLVVGVAIGFGSGLWSGFVAGVVSGLAVGITVWIARRRSVLRPASVSARLCFLLARAWLSARGLLPFRLTQFLDDACARQVLRQVGVVHQFRHERLRVRLRAQPIVNGSLGSGLPPVRTDLSPRCPPE